MANIYLALACVLEAGMSGIQQELTLRPGRHEEGQEPEPLPTSFAASLECLEQDEMLMSVMSKAMSKAYLACRRVEVERSAKMTLEDEVKEALERA